MPIILNTDPDEVHRLEIGDAWVEYTRANGDEFDRARVAHIDRETGEPDDEAAYTDVMVAHVTGWGGFLAANGEPLDFADDRVRVFVEVQSPIVRTLLKDAVSKLHMQAVSSGKD